MISESILQGERVRLRPPHEADLPLFVAWFNDPDVRYWLGVSEDPELTLDAEREWYEETRSDPAQVVWCIEKADGQPIGNIGLHAINETHRRATLGISLGECGLWGRGYGTEAVRQALRYGFGDLGLQRIDLNVDDDNLRAIRCYEKCGFKGEGRLRAYRLRRGQPVNGLIMSVLREEFETQPWR